MLRASELATAEGKEFTSLTLDGDARREQAELSADELNDIMERAQKATYGDGLDERYLQKFMWTWKPHYYSPDVSFYNYPYAFGLLFATGLYAIYKQRGADFVEDYKNLLASTGEVTAAKLAKRFGIDITMVVGMLVSHFVGRRYGCRSLPQMPVAFISMTTPSSSMRARIHARVARECLAMFASDSAIAK